MEIRRSAVTEATALAEIWLRSRAASVPAIPSPSHSEEEVRSWFADVVLPTAEVWIAESNGRPVALLVIENEWIDQLYVDPIFVGQGIGGALLSHAKALRPKGLRLWTFQANADARRFYKRHGFIAVITTEGDNEEGAPDVRYEWRPSQATDATSV